MGRKRKDFTGKLKIEVAKEALKKRVNEAEVSAKNDDKTGFLAYTFVIF